jgi:thiamine-phosphate pyrophosphorylase
MASNPFQHLPRPLVYLITDRRQLKSSPGRDPIAALSDFIAVAFASGVDLVQIRERDLSARTLYALVSDCVRTARQYNRHVLVNDWADVAAAAGAGVHLTTRSISPEVIRKRFGTSLLIGTSTHSLREAQAAERGGSDFIVFGPVFETESKSKYGPPIGLESLGEVAGQVSIPVLALGGITVSNFTEALDAGSAGIAGISIFTGAQDLRGTVDALKHRP